MFGHIWTSLVQHEITHIGKKKKYWLRGLKPTKRNEHVAIYQHHDRLHGDPISIVVAWHLAHAGCWMNPWRWSSTQQPNSQGSSGKRRTWLYWSPAGTDVLCTNKTFGYFWGLQKRSVKIFHHKINPMLPQKGKGEQEQQHVYSWLSNKHEKASHALYRRPSI